LAVENPQKEIRREAQLSIITDGIGCNFLNLGGTPKINQEGEEIIEFVIKVDEIVQRTYNLRRGYELDEQDNMKWTVKKIDLIPFNQYDDSNRRWLYVNTLKHEPTEFSKREANLKTIINIKDKRILLLEAENIRLNEQIMLFRTNPAMAAAQGAEVFEKTAEAVAKLIRPQEKGQ
jgi:hypothetical protein